MLPVAQPVFGVTEYLGWEWLLIFALALTPVTAVEVVKLMGARVRAEAASSDVEPEEMLLQAAAYVRGSLPQTGLGVAGWLWCIMHRGIGGTLGSHGS